MNRENKKASALGARARWSGLLGGALAVLVVWSAAGAQLAGANGSVLAEALAGRVGRFLIAGTAEGKFLAKQVLGRSIGSLSDLDDFLKAASKGSGFEAELAERLKRIEAAFARNRIPETAETGAIARLTEADRQLLRALASEGLKAQPGSGGRIEFLAPMSGGSFTTAGRRFLDRAARPMRGELAHVIPGDAWSGTLAERIRKFTSLWPRNVAWVPSVSFRLSLGGGRQVAADRPVMVIAKGTSSDADWNGLLEDYVRAVARGTISFPLIPGEGHLETRIGSKLLDWMGDDVSVKSFVENMDDAIFSFRLEPVVELTSAEEARLLEYAKNVVSRGERTLGDFSIRGVPSAETRGLVTNNRPVAALEGCGHNCTTWITTAPIGPRGAPLLRMVGAEPGIEVHTNPGWWNSFLLAGGDPRRVRFATYWSSGDLSLDEVVRSTARAMEGWNFNRH